MEESRGRWLATIEGQRHHPKAPANDHTWVPELDPCSREQRRAIRADKLPHAVAPLDEPVMLNADHRL
jgi:hypothetical protein